MFVPDLKENYLEYLYKRITSETQYDPDTSILEKCIQDYQLQNLDFPFTANSQMYEFLDWASIWACFCRLKSRALWHCSECVL